MAADTSGPRRYWLKDEPPDLSSEGADAFAVREVVARLSDLISVSPHPFTIALSGSWGSGKTTVAQDLARRVRGRVPSCLVDLWTEDITELRRRIVIETAVALRSRGTSEDDARTAAAQKLDEATKKTHSTPLPATVDVDWKKTKKTLRRHWHRVVEGVVWLVNVFLVGLLIRYYLPDVWGAFAPTLPPLLVALATFVALRSGLLIQLTTTTETVAPAEPAVELQRQFREMVTVGGSDAPPVLVVVDNLDRVPADDALRALKEIRALVEIPNSRCVFLVPVDRRAFVQQLAGQLGSAKAARDYLDKFFNLDLPLTQPEPLDLRSWAHRLLERLFSDEGYEDDALRTAAEVVASGSFGSPRLVKRVVNGMATRRGLIDEALRANLTLAQVGLTEAIIAQSPELVEPLVRRPRRFVELREAVAGASNRDVAAGLVRSFLDTEGVLLADEEQRVGLGAALADVLLANGGIDLSIDDLRILLSLRGERFWGGVQDPSRLRLAMDTGQSAEVDAYLADQTTEQDKRAAVIKGSEWIDELAGTFPAAAVKATVALSAHLDLDQGALTRARNAARRALAATSPAEGLNLLSRSAAELVFAQQPDARSRLLWNTAVSSLGLADATVNGVVSAVRAGATHRPPHDRRRAQADLAQVQPEEALDALFTEPTEPQLIDGAVANRYAEQLSSWDIQKDPEGSSVANAVQRLGQCSLAGWSDVAMLDRIATAFGQQLPRVASLSGSAIHLFDGVVSLLGAQSSPAVNQFALVLSTWAGKPRAAILALALKLQTDPTTAAQTKQAIEAWLLPATPADVENLFADAAGPLRERIPTYRAILLRRWAAGEGVQLAKPAVEDGTAEAVTALVQAIALIPDANFRVRGVEACVLAREHFSEPAAQGQLEQAVASRVPAVSIAALRESGPLLEALAALESPLDATAARLADRVRAAPRDDLANLLPVGIGLAALRPSHRELLTKAFVDRAAQLGTAPLSVLQWLVEQAETKQDRDALAGMLEVEFRSAANPISAVVSTAARVRGALPKGVVLVSLAQRAAAASCEEARVLLDEAVLWLPLPSTKRDELQPLLTEIGARCPELIESIKRLRGERDE